MKSESEIAQLCPTLCNPMDCSLLGSSVHGIFPARILEWDAIAFSDIVSGFGQNLEPSNKSSNEWRMTPGGELFLRFGKTIIREERLRVKVKTTDPAL